MPQERSINIRVTGRNGQKALTVPLHSPPGVIGWVSVLGIDGISRADEVGAGGVDGDVMSERSSKGEDKASGAGIEK